MSNTISSCWCGGRAVMASAQPSQIVCLDSVYHDPIATGRRDKHTKLYLAGPMSGYPDNNYPRFHLNAMALRSAGFEVVNPAEGVHNPGERVHYVDLLRQDIRVMLDCHAVAVMDRWWESGGARNEVNVAGILKMPVRSVEEWLDRADVELAP